MLDARELLKVEQSHALTAKRREQIEARLEVFSNTGSRMRRENSDLCTGERQTTP